MSVTNAVRRAADRPLYARVGHSGRSKMFSKAAVGPCAVSVSQESIALECPEGAPLPRLGMAPIAGVAASDPGPEGIPPEKSVRSAKCRRPVGYPSFLTDRTEP